MSRVKKVPTIVHAGFPKCASTTIQHNFFAKQADSLFVSRKANSGDKRYWKLYERLSKCLTQGERIPSAKQAWQKVVEENADCRTFIFSDERLTLPGRHCHFTSVIERPYIVKRIFPDARIIIVLRQPLDYLRSLYQQMGVNTYRKDATLPKPFPEWLDQDIVAAKYKRGAVSQGLYFGEIAIRYSEFFGKKNVGIFFLEDLKADSNRFFHIMAEFMDLPDPFIPTAASLASKNVTSEKETMLEIAGKVPYFSNPEFPKEFLDQANPFLRTQARYLKEMLDVDVSTRWPTL